MPKEIELIGCVNCKACEMACSMHHTGVFSYKHSSIQISQLNDRYVIRFKEPNTCDTCEGEGDNNYQCIKYCYRAKDALAAFIKESENGGAEK